MGWLWSINAYISDERQQASLDFIEWFAQEDVQARWAELGGLTTNKSVLESPGFAEIRVLQCCLCRIDIDCERFLEYS